MSTPIRIDQRAHMECALGGIVFRWHGHQHIEAHLQDGTVEHIPFTDVAPTRREPIAALSPAVFESLCVKYIRRQQEVARREAERAERLVITLDTPLIEIGRHYGDDPDRDDWQNTWDHLDAIDDELIPADQTPADWGHTLEGLIQAHGEAVTVRDLRDALIAARREEDRPSYGPPAH